MGSNIGSLGDSEAKLARKDEELALADVVVTPARLPEKVWPARRS